MMFKPAAKVRLWNSTFLGKHPWPRFLGLHPKASVFPASPSLLALQGEIPERILEVSAAALLERSGAIRAGVWMQTSEHDTHWVGKVVQAGEVPAPAGWLSLDPSALFPGSASESARSTVFRKPEFPREPSGFFDGTELAICFPLILEGRRFGAALVAGKRSRLLVRRELLEAAAIELATALSLGTARHQWRAANRSSQFRADMDLTIAQNASEEEILKIVAAGVVRNTGAEFAGFGCLQGSALHWVVLSGSESQAAFSYPGLFDVASEIRKEYQPAIRSFPSGDKPSIWVAGLALDPPDKDSLLLLAAYRSEDAVPLNALRQFAIVAVAARKTARAASAGAGLRQGEPRQLAAELRCVLEAAQCGILLLDRSGSVRHLNDCLKDYLGIEAGASPANYDDLARLAKPMLRNPGAFCSPWEAFTQGSCAEFRDELVLAGIKRQVLAREARPVSGEDGQPIGWLEIYRDITSQRQIQSKLFQTEKMAALGQLVSGIAHELNNPLTSIMGYAQLLLGRGADAPGGEARMIFGEAERARRIVKNLLFFARRAEPERTRVDINEIIERTVALRGYELKIENIAVATYLAPDLPPTLADPYQLQQVILNLMVNAEQAILEGRGYGRIEIHTRRVSPARLAIEVSDDGPGIPPGIVSRIFDPFFTTKAPGVGTGLGLSIVYGIMEQHGGEVSFENLSGGGAKFTLELPILAVPAPAAVSSPEISPRPSDRASGRVLVIEDEPTVAQLVADVLREEGHQVEAVLDSQDGLRRISRADYDLIICDLRMPRLGGTAFYDALVRANSPARHRILFITGDTLGARTVEFLKSRQLPFLAKPFLVEELKLAVSRILQGNVSPVPARLAGMHGR